MKNIIIHIHEQQLYYCFGKKKGDGACELVDVHGNSAFSIMLMFREKKACVVGGARAVGDVIAERDVAGGLNMFFLH